MIEKILNKKEYYNKFSFGFLISGTIFSIFVSTTRYGLGIMMLGLGLFFAKAAEENEPSNIYSKKLFWLGVILIILLILVVILQTYYTLEIINFLK